MSRQSKIFLQERIFQRMCEEIGVIEVHQISGQESVEAVNFSLKSEFQRTCEQNTGLSSAQGLKPGECRGSQKMSFRSRNF